MKSYLKISVLVGACLLTSACPQLKTRSEVNEQENQKQIQSQVTTIQQTKMDQDNKILAIQDELRNLSGRLQSIEYKLSQPAVATNHGPSNQELIEQMKIFENQIQALKAELEDAKNKNSTSTAPTINKELAKPSSNEKGAESWDMAENYFEKKDWKNAILSYQSYRDQNAKGKNYSSATYKIGVCFQELKMKDEARAFYEEVLQKFPKSQTAKKAKFRLGQLK